MTHQNAALMAGMLSTDDKSQRFTFGRTNRDIPAGSLVAINLIGERHLLMLDESIEPEKALAALQVQHCPRAMNAQHVIPLGKDKLMTPHELREAKRLKQMADDFREHGTLPVRTTGPS